MFVLFCADLQRICIGECLYLSNLQFNLHAYAKSCASSQGGLLMKSFFSGVVSASSVSTLRKDYFQK